jgi:hypothetical protein
MKHTQAYRNQHDEIRSATRALANVASSGDVPAIRKSLTHLSALIDVHVSLEDTAFYPALYKYADPELGRIAKAYQESMGKLASVYAAFCSRWMQRGAIEEDPCGFAKELNDVCSTLERRMDLENNTLYMMVDGLTNIAV